MLEKLVRLALIGVMGATASFHNPDYLPGERAKIEVIINEGKLNPARAGVLIVDMQEDYLANINQEELGEELIPNQIKIIKYAQKNSIPIFVLEYDLRGPTTSSLIRVLEKGQYTVIRKDYDNGFRDTQLDEKLVDKKVNSIILMGVNASGCVKMTASGGYVRGYLVVTSPDLIANDTNYVDKQEGRTWYKNQGMWVESHKIILGVLESTNSQTFQKSFQ